MHTALVVLSLAACFTDGVTVKASPQGPPELELFRDAAAHCEGDQLVVSFSAWPAPWRLTRAGDGTWHEAVAPALATSGPVVDRYRVAQSWLAREEALLSWAQRNPAVKHDLALPRLQAALDELKREAAPRLSAYTRLGSMPGAQSPDQAYWSADGFCVAQGKSGKVRCFTAGKGWGKAVPRSRRPAVAGEAAFTHQGQTVSLGPIQWQVAELGGAPWLDSSDARDCAASIPTREAIEAAECADPDSQRCAAWGRYAPIGWPTACDTAVERVLWAPGGGAVVVVARLSHEHDRAGLLGLWLATVSR